MTVVFKWGVPILITGDTKGKVKVRPPPSSPLPVPPPAHRSRTNTSACINLFAPWPACFALHQAWNTKTWTVMDAVASPVRYATSMAAFDGLLFTGNSDGTFSTWTVGPLKVEVAHVAHGKGNVADVFVVDGTVVTCSDDFTVRVRRRTAARCAATGAGVSQAMTLLAHL